MSKMKKTASSISQRSLQNVPTAARPRGVKASTSVPSLDLASVNNSLQIATVAEKASESLKVNDQLLLEKTDLKA